MKTNVGKFLAKLRIDESEDMITMSKRIGTHVNQLRYIENGNRDVTLKLICKIIDEYKLAATQTKEMYFAALTSNKKITIENVNEINKDDLILMANILSKM